MKHTATSNTVDPAPDEGEEGLPSVSSLLLTTIAQLLHRQDPRLLPPGLVRSAEGHSTRKPLSRLPDGVNGQPLAIAARAA